MTLAENTLPSLGPFLAPSISVISILVSIVLFWRSRPKIAVDWQRRTDEPLLSTASPDGITVLHHGDALDNPRILTVRLRNAGRKAIAIDDWWSEPTITVPLAKIKSATVLRVSDDAPLELVFAIDTDNTLAG